MIAPFAGRIAIDIGTGDGRFVYRSALRQPEGFFIGIDANVRQLAKISEKIYRRREKGGAPNALFLQSSAEELPEELNGIASEVRIQFPWGSLLRSVATGEGMVLNNLRQMCLSGASLKIFIGLDPERDKSEIKRLGIPDLSANVVKQNLVVAYSANGFRISDYTVIRSSRWPSFESTWAKKLRHNATRTLIYLEAKAT